MRANRRKGSTLLFAGAAAALVLAASGTTRLRVSEPAPHATVVADGGELVIRGRAELATGHRRPLDLVLVLDVSRSTRLASGSDVDADGELGVPRGPLGSTDPDDTVLAAEVAAARALLRSLENPRARVGLVGFSGAADARTGLRLGSGERDARLRAPLTEDRAAVSTALDRLLEEGAHGATNFEAGIRTATEALLAADGVAADRAIVFLTDGLPSFPVGRADVSDPGDTERAIEAAEDAADAGIRIHTFALGADAVAEPEAAVEIARRTAGSFTALPEPATIIGALGDLTFGGSGRIRITNLADGQEAHAIEVQPDGRFEARVRAGPGATRIRVEAGSPPVHVDIPVTVDVPRQPGTRRRLEIQVEPDEPPTDTPGPGEVPES